MSLALAIAAHVVAPAKASASAPASAGEAPEASFHDALHSVSGAAGGSEKDESSRSRSERRSHKSVESAGAALAQHATAQPPKPLTAPVAPLCPAVPEPSEAPSAAGGPPEATMLQIQASSDPIAQAAPATNTETNSIGSFQNSSAESSAACSAPGNPQPSRKADRESGSGSSKQALPLSMGFCSSELQVSSAGLLQSESETAAGAQKNAFTPLPGGPTPGALTLPGGELQSELSVSGFGNTILPNEKNGSNRASQAADCEFPTMQVPPQDSTPLVEKSRGALELSSALTPAKHPSFLDGSLQNSTNQSGEGASNRPVSTAALNAPQQAGFPAAKSVIGANVATPGISDGVPTAPADAKGAKDAPAQPGHVAAAAGQHRLNSGEGSGNSTSNQAPGNVPALPVGSTTQAVGASGTVLQLHPQAQSATALAGHLESTSSGPAMGSLPDGQTLHAPTQVQELINTARLIQNLHQSQIHVGIHSADFGNISIETSVSRSSLSAQISLDHPELAKVIADSIPQIHETLGPNQHLDIRIATSGQSNSTLDSHSGGSNGNSQDAWRSGTTSRAGPGGFSSRGSPSMAIESRTWAVDTSDQSRLDVRI